MFLYTNSKTPEKEINYPIRNSIKNNEFFSIRFTKEVKYLYNEKHMTLMMKEIEEDTNKWKGIYETWIHPGR